MSIGENQLSGDAGLWFLVQTPDSLKLIAKTSVVSVSCGTPWRARLDRRPSRVRRAACPDDKPRRVRLCNYPDQIVPRNAHCAEPRGRASCLSSDRSTASPVQPQAQVVLPFAAVELGNGHEGPRVSPGLIRRQVIDAQFRGSLAASGHVLG